VSKIAVVHNDGETVSGENFEISRLLFWVTAVESGVLFVAGLGLLLFPSLLSLAWPWDLTPFTALLLGAIYTASLVATAMTAYVHRWAPARIVVPMIFLFTAVVLVVSVIYLDRFDGSYSTWLWFFLYLVIPLNALYHIWLYRGRKPFVRIPIPNHLRWVLLVPTILLGIYGLGLLISPESLSGFWPWPIDDFHGRMYSVLYMTPALGALLLYKAAAPIETFTMGLTQGIGGLVPMVGLAIVDRDLNKVDWTQAGTWVWIGSFGILFLTGVGLVLTSRSQVPPKPLFD